MDEEIDRLAIRRGKRNPAEVELQNNHALLALFWLMTVVTYWAVVICGYLSPYVGFHQAYPAIRNAAYPELRRFLEAHDNGWGLGNGIYAGSRDARQELMFLCLWTCICAVVTAAGLHMHVYSGYLISLTRTDSAWRLLHEEPPTSLRPEGSGELGALEVIRDNIFTTLRLQRHDAHEERLRLLAEECKQQELNLQKQGEVRWHCDGVQAGGIATEMLRAQGLQSELSRCCSPRTKHDTHAVPLRSEATRRRLVGGLVAQNQQEEQAAARMHINIMLQGSMQGRIVKGLAFAFSSICRELGQTVRGLWTDCFSGGPLVDEITEGAKIAGKGQPLHGELPQWAAIGEVGFKLWTLAVQQLLARRLIGDACVEQIQKKQVHRHRNPDLIYANPYFPYNTRRNIKLMATLYCLSWIPLGVGAALTSSLLGSLANFYGTGFAAGSVLGPIVGLHALGYMLLDGFITAICVCRGQALPCLVPKGKQRVPLGVAQEPRPLDSAVVRSAAAEEQGELKRGMRCSRCEDIILPRSFYVGPPVLPNSVFSSIGDFRPPDGQPCEHAMHAGCYFASAAPWCCTCAAVYVEGAQPWTILITPRLMTLALACFSFGIRCLEGSAEEIRSTGSSLSPKARFRQLPASDH